MDKFRAELHLALLEEGYPLGACMYEWPDVEMAEVWKQIVTEEMKEWERTPAKAI